jgi:hypothetical protein
MSGYRIDLTEDCFRVMDLEGGTEDCYAEFDTIRELRRDTQDEIKKAQERIAIRLEENNEDLWWIAKMEALLETAKKKLEEG